MRASISSRGSTFAPGGGSGEDDARAIAASRSGEDAVGTFRGRGAAVQIAQLDVGSGDTCADPGAECGRLVDVEAIDVLYAT